MVFPLINTSSTLLPSSLGSHKFWLFVFFWALPPFTLSVCRWATGLPVSKLPKHLSVIPKYWHKPSVNRFLNSAWWRAALRKEHAICRSFHCGETASIARFPFCSYTASRRSITDAVRGHCRFFSLLSLNPCHLSPHTRACHPTPTVYITFTQSPERGLSDCKHEKNRQTISLDSQTFVLEREECEA